MTELYGARRARGVHEGCVDHRAGGAREPYDAPLATQAIRRTPAPSASAAADPGSPPALS